MTPMAAEYAANIHMALHPQQYPDIPELFLTIDLPFRFFFVWFIWRAIAPERAQHQHPAA